MPHLGLQLGPISWGTGQPASSVWAQRLCIWAGPWYMLPCPTGHVTQRSNAARVSGAAGGGCGGPGHAPWNHSADR